MRHSRTFEGERAGSGIPNIYHVWKTQNWQGPILTEQFQPGSYSFIARFSGAKIAKIAKHHGKRHGKHHGKYQGK